MADKDAFKERERGLEEAYFLKKEKELIEKLRERAALEEERRKLSDQIGVTNDEILQALQGLGYNHETVKLLHLMPIIHIAWANGKMSAKERRLIIDVAREAGVAEGSEADHRLQALLEKAPSQEIWDASFLAIRAVLAAVPGEERDSVRNNVLTFSTAIASLSKGLFGIESLGSSAERSALERVVNELAPGDSPAARQVLEDRLKV